MSKQYDDDWDNRKAFPEVEAWNEKCRERSLNFSRSVNFQMDNAFGSEPRNRIDVLPVKKGLPTFFHIHGGYWQWNNKEDAAISSELSAKIYNLDIIKSNFNIYKNISKT